MPAALGLTHPARRMLNLLRLSFLPLSADIGLLLLRVSLGFTMLILHGWVKVQNFSSIAPKFLPLFGLPSDISLGMAIFAEVLCSVLLIVGLFTRFAALNLTITMAVAFFIAHGAKFTGERPGELAFVYMTGFITLLFAGGGKYAADGK
ncbi:DoxX family protein [Prosthecobacter sp. SYSU 5D2]|uniref:DoxX family protein n=1 Tax=Prosthecobacter sp. SYSU 5D2 TaxID=3134134 RepID=UPI0031FF1542